jgi:hypothetical protein
VWSRENSYSISDWDRSFTPAHPECSPGTSSYRLDHSGSPRRGITSS